VAGWGQKPGPAGNKAALSKNFRTAAKIGRKPKPAQTPGFLSELGLPPIHGKAAGFYLMPGMTMPAVAMFFLIFLEAKLSIVSAMTSSRPLTRVVNQSGSCMVCSA